MQRNIHRPRLCKPGQCRVFCAAKNWTLKHLLGSSTSAVTWRTLLLPSSRASTSTGSSTASPRLFRIPNRNLRLWNQQLPCEVEEWANTNATLVTARPKCNPPRSIRKAEQAVSTDSTVSRRDTNLQAHRSPPDHRCPTSSDHSLHYLKGFSTACSVRSKKRLVSVRGPWHQDTLR